MTTEQIKELLKNVKTRDEALAILQDNNLELTDEELDEISGGIVFADQSIKPSILV